MSNLAVKTLVLAWRDCEFYADLPEQERRILPANPAGDFNLAVVDTTTQNSNTFISDTCSTFISDCCSTFISNTCSTFISDCC